jgi:uncharacterized membrane protein YhiD involved in acid resistance
MNFKDIIKQSILDNFTGDMSPERIAITLLAALVFGVYIFFVYRVAVSNEFYSKDFNKSLTLMAVTTAAIVLSIQSNLVISLGMVGALSIVRFRTAVKSPLDLFFLYWAISIGIICGAGLYLLAVLSSVLITAIILLMDRFQSPVSLSVLVVLCDSIDTGMTVTETVKDCCDFSRLKNKTVTSSKVELVLEVKITDESALEKALSELSGIQQYSVLSFDRETRI